jgi:hypothetical protein
MHSSLWKDGLIVMWKSLLFPASCYLLKLDFVSLITWLLWIPKLNMFLFCPADFRDKFIFWTMVNLQELCSCYRGSCHKVGRKDKVSIPCWLLSYEIARIVQISMVRMMWSIKYPNVVDGSTDMLNLLSLFYPCWWYILSITNCLLYDTQCCILVGEIFALFWIFTTHFLA